MIKKELQTFFSIPKVYVFGGVSVIVEEYTLEEYLYFLDFTEKKKFSQESIKVFLNGLLGGEGFDNEGFEKMLLKNNGIEIVIYEELTKSFQEEAEKKNRKKNNSPMSIIRQMTFVMMHTSLTEKDLLNMPYKRFFLYIDALGYWIREKTEEGQKENKKIDALKRYSGKKSSTESYYEARKQFQKLRNLKK